MRKTLLFLGLMLTMVLSAQPKREFRGAWIQSVNGQFMGMGTEAMQKTLSYQLDELQKDGCNVIIFQVRPECDALYESSLEPWSCYLTGRQGKAPQPYWDPLAWMVQQCHQRGMELHAWINPYRAKTKTAHANASNHVVVQHPERCFDYDGLKVLNPALKENRDYICQVVTDILERYARNQYPRRSQFQGRSSRFYRYRRLAQKQRKPVYRTALGYHPHRKALGEVRCVAFRHLPQSEERPQRQ